MMNKLMLFLGITLFLSSCVPLVKDNDPSNPVPTKKDIAWENFSAVNAELLIKCIHTSASEMAILTNNQLFRIDANLRLIEKRTLAADKQIYGSPVCSDKTFLRISQGNNNMQVVEFHLMKTPSVVKKFFTSELVDVVRNESFLIDVFSRTPGTFSTDGKQFFLPGTVYPSYKPTVMIFDVVPNAQGNDFSSIKLSKRVEIPNLSTDGKIESCRYLKGNFYLATKDGGFRISPDGQVKKLFNTWSLDFFEYDNKIYANSTDFNVNDFYVSSDNGLTWKKVGIAGQLRYVEPAGEKLFSHSSRNVPYNVADVATAKEKQVVYVNDFKEKSDNYYSIGFFQNKYFISVGNQIFTINSIQTK